VETSALTAKTMPAIAAIAATKARSAPCGPSPRAGNAKVSAPMPKTGSSHAKLRATSAGSAMRSARTMRRMRSRRSQDPARNAATGRTKPMRVASGRACAKFTSVNTAKRQA
jgi:hypothetical protein